MDFAGPVLLIELVHLVVFAWLKRRALCRLLAAEQQLRVYKSVRSSGRPSVTATACSGFCFPNSTRDGVSTLRSFNPVPCSSGGDAASAIGGVASPSVALGVRPFARPTSI